MIRELYERLGYKKLMIIPVLILLICSGFLLIQKEKTGEWLLKGFDLKGGSQLTFEIEKNVDVNDLKLYLKKNVGEVEVRKISSVGGNSLLIRSEELNETSLIKNLNEYGLNVNGYSFQEIGATLGESFFSQSMLAIFIALLFMGIVVFVVFRNFVPSLAVIFAAVSDIICTIGIMQAVGMEISLASFAGLLMVIGYSIDTDILLTTRLLKRREGEMMERIHSILKTGLTMSATSLMALLGLFFASGSIIFQEISFVLIVALLIDIPNTYLMNLGILRWWMEKKGIE